MRRLFWVALGATAGVLVVRRLSTTAQAYTPEGVATSMGALAEALRDFAGTVREGMAQREEELRAALGAGAQADEGIDPDRARHVVDHPTS